MPQVIEIPEVGNVEFPDGMDATAIEAASRQLYTEARQANRDTFGPPPVDFMGEAARAAAPVFQANRREAMQEEMQTARRTQERADLAATIFDGTSEFLRPFASTPENPLGGFGSAARPVGAALNALGDESARVAGHVVGSYGGVLGPVGQDVARAVPGVAAAMAGGPVMRAIGVPAELAPAAAFGAVPFAQTLDATGDTFAASKAGVTGAAIPGVADAGRAAAAKTLGALVESGVISTGATAAGNMGQKVVEALGAQGALQVFMEGMNLPEYMAMTPEERQAALLHNLAVNSAFLMMDVPGVFSRAASQTRQGMKPAAKVGELMETLVNDPATVKALTDAADKFALDQMNVRENPRIAQLEAPPVQLENYEPRFIDPSLPKPTMGQEVKVEPEPLIAAPETKEALERPAVTIEPSKAPAAAAPTAAPERIVATAIRHPETGELTAAPNKIHIQLFEQAGVKASRLSARQVEDASGFLTDTGRFVSREEANALAERQGLIGRGEDVMGEHVAGRQKAAAPEPTKYRLQEVPGQKDVEIRSERGAMTLRATTKENADGTFTVESMMAFVPPGILDPRAAPRQVIDLAQPITAKTGKEARRQAYEQFVETLNKGEFKPAPEPPTKSEPISSPLVVAPKPAKVSPQVAQPLKMQDDAVLVYDRNGVPTGVQGKRYILPGFEDVEFVMTRPTGAKAKGTKRGWTLWEKSSGLAIAESADIKSKPTSEQEAVQMAMQRLQGLGRSGLEARTAAQRQAIEQMRLSKAKALDAPAKAVEKVQEHVGGVPYYRNLGEQDALDLSRKRMRAVPHNFKLAYIDGWYAAKKAKKPATLNVAPEPPAAAVEKVQEHVAEVAAGQKKATPEPALQHTTGPRAAKEIKSELVQRIEEAMEKAPELNAKQRIAFEDGPVLVKERDYVAKDSTKDKREGQIDAVRWVAAENAKRREAYNAAIEATGVKRITIEIPGDGTFNVWNTKEALGEMLKRANRLTTTTGTKGFSENLPTKTQGQMWMRDASVNPADSYYVHAGGDEFVKVEGKPVKLEEYPPGDFFVHRPIEKGSSGWSVSESRSGMRIGHGTTEKAAIAKARENLSKYGPEQVEASLKSAKPSPRAQAPAESINTGALGEAGMGGAKPTEFTATFDTAVGIKNAKMKEQAAAYGLTDLWNGLETQRKGHEEAWQEAMARLDNDPLYARNLVEELIQHPRTASDVEEVALLHHGVDLKIRHARLTREMAAALEDSGQFPNRLAALEAARVAHQENLKLVERWMEASRTAGREWGRSGRMRQRMMEADYSLAQMEVDAIEKKSAPLTDAERARLTEAHGTIQRLQAELDAAQKVAEEARAERRAAEATEDLKQAAKADPEYNPQVIKFAARIVEKLESTGKAAEAEWKRMMARTSAGIDPTLLAVAVKIGAGKIARKAMPFAEWAQAMVDAVGESIRPYLEPAWEKLGERMDRVATDIAGRKKAEAFKKMRVVDEGQRRQKLIDSLTEAAGEERPLDEIGTYVRRLALQFVKDGIDDRNKLVDAVHSVLVNHFDPEITRREAMDAISGYGDFKPLDPDPAKRTLRDLKGQLQSVAKLEDIEARRPLLKTGVERRAPSDEERRLIQQVNEAKRVHGVVTTDPARQLKSAQDAILARLKHQIADLNFQIDAGERTVKSAAKVASTPEIDALRIERDALKRRLDEMLPRPGISEAQRLAMAERALEADLALYEAKIAARDTGPLRAKSAKLHSEKLEQLRARRDVLKAELNELRAAANPKLTPEERALRTLKRRLATEYAKTMDRIARQDFTPRRRVQEPVMDSEAATRKGRLDHAKAEWRRALVAEKRKNRSGGEKGWDAAKEVTHAQRQFWTSMDLSAVLRQGGVIVAGHPIRGLKAMPAMFRALSETQANAEWAKVQSRPNWSRYQRAKLYLSDPHETTITKLEEQVRSRWLQNVPGIKQSNQTYTTFLNKLRADSFDAMVSALERKGTTLNDAELQGIANYINITTGRGDFGKLAGAADTLAMALFSPRLLLSRFQYILGQPIVKAGSWRVRRQIAAEYARTLAGFGVVLALGALAGAEIETDERSSDFLKLKFGNTRIDFGAGLLQPLVYLARTIHGETKTAGGEVKPIRGAVPFGSQNWWDVTGNFARSKFSPSMGTTVDLLTGKNVIGEKATLGTAARDFAVPLSFREVGEIMRQHGVPEGTTLMLLGLFGAGVSTRENDARARAIVGELMKRIQGGTPEHREAVRERLMNSLKK